MAKYLDNDGLLYFWQRIKATFARLSSPAFTGTPTAPTAASGTSTTQLATTEFVANAVAASASGVTGVKGNSESSYRTGNVNLTAANVGAAPTSHASSATTYGTGTGSNYGHVKLSDGINGTETAASGGTAATPKAVADAIAAAESYADSHDEYITYTVSNDGATAANGLKVKLAGVYTGGGNAPASTATFTGSEIVTVIGTNSVLRAKNDSNGDPFTSTYAKLASPALTGTPTAPTAAASTNNTQIATTAFVTSAIATAQSGAAMFKGTIGSSTSTATYTQATLESAAYKAGWYFVVNSAGTYVGHVCGVGDVIYCVKSKSTSYSADDFTVVQNEIDSITNAEIDAIVAQ